MAKFPYTASTKRLTDFLDKIQSVKVPDAVTSQWMESLGFDSRNDSYTKGILEAMGFIDSDGVPQERWKTHRLKAQAPAALAAGIKEAYSDLFEQYADPLSEGDSALKAFFKANTNLADKTVNCIVRTVRVLSERAVFGAVVPEAPQIESVAPPTAELQPKAAAAPALRKETVTTQGVTVNVNIQLTLPETKDSAIYDAIFESLKKNILSQD